MECKRYFDKNWVGAVILCLIPMIAENLYIFPLIFTEQIDAISPMINIFEKSSLFPVSLLAVTIVCSTAFLEDKANRSFFYHVFRCGKHRYALCRFFSIILMSASAIVFAQIIFMAFAIICFPFPDVGYYHPSTESALALISIQNPILVYLLSFGLQIFEYAAWAGLALAASTFYTNQYVVIFVPFIFYTILTVFCTYAEKWVSNISVILESLLLPFILTDIASAGWSAALSRFAILFLSMMLLSYLVFLRRGVVKSA